MSERHKVGIVFTDVDGTLVGADHHPLPWTAPIMRALCEQLPICLVSARSPEGLYPIQRQLDFVGPLACFSGAYVLDAQGNELLSTTIALDDAVEIKRYLVRELPDLTVGTYGFHRWIVDDRSDSRIANEERLVQTESEECSDLTAAFDERGVHKFLLMGEPEAIMRAEREVAERYSHLNVVRSSDTLCEVMSKSASKGGAVRLLCEWCGVSIADAVAFGDGPNDADMLAAVAQSYAMANAEPSVKRAATHVVPWTNEEGGVARMLERLCL